jgi:hypothetical protein
VDHRLQQQLLLLKQPLLLRQHLAHNILPGIRHKDWCSSSSSSSSSSVSRGLLLLLRWGEPLPASARNRCCHIPRSSS